MLQAEQPEQLEVPESVRSPFTVRGFVYRAATAAWHLGVTPGCVVRTSGPLARRFSQNYVDRRMHDSLNIPREECDAFEPYIFGCLAGRGSGEVRVTLQSLVLMRTLPSVAPHKCSLLLLRSSCSCMCISGLNPTACASLDPAEANQRSSHKGMSYCSLH